MRLPITSSEKDFKNRAKAYTCTVDALKEIIVNSFFAPNAKNIFFNKNEKSIWFINDGEPMTRKQVIDAISKYGCESNNTAGNENGIGLKSTASYFSCDTKDFMLGLLSKKGNSTICFGWIDCKGNYCDESELTEKQKKFVDFISSKFENGVATVIFDTNKGTEEDFEKFEDDLRYMFSTGLKNINIISEIGGEHTINYHDRLYLDLDYIPHLNQEVVFEYKDKLFKCRIACSYTNKIKPEDYDFIDEVTGNLTHDFGIHMGYDNGYMPIHVPQVAVLGFKNTLPQYYYIRGALIAEPIENDEKHAGVKQWQELYSKIGKMSQQKVPNLSTPVNYFFTNGRKELQVRQNIKSFYDTVIQAFKDFYNENRNKQMLESNTPTNEKSEDTFDSILLTNKKLEKESEKRCNETWKFKVEEIDVPVHFSKKDKTITFSCKEDSAFYRKITFGGKRDTYESLLTTIDVFKMDMLDCETTDKIYSVINKRVKQFNYYYGS